MARRTKVQIEEDAQVKADQESAIGRLKEYGLDLGDKVRFRRGKGMKWKTGKAMYVNKDDSICLITEHGFHSITSENIEKQTDGPRGGKVWTALE